MEDTIRVCERCLYKVYPSCLDEYDYQCIEHDEDLYEIETKEMKKEEYLDSIAQRLDCDRDKVEEIHDQYDDYVMNEYLHESPIELLISLEDFYISKIRNDIQFIYYKL